MTLSDRYHRAKIKNEMWAVDADDIAELSLRNKPKYDEVSAATGFPWWLVAIIHSLESDQNFRTHLHNGDSLNARTVQVPAGRPRKGNPPFTWVESAIDALSVMEYKPGLESILDFLERYNGLGYRYDAGRDTTPPSTSPYLWSGTTEYVKGKYVADGAFDREAVSQQVGAAALLKRFEHLNVVNFKEGNTNVGKSEATWIGFHRDPKSKYFSIVGYNGDAPVNRIDTNLIAALQASLNENPGAKTFVVSEKPAPLVPLMPTEEEPTPVKGTTSAVLTRYLDSVKMPQVWRAVGLKPLCLKIADEEFLCVSGQGYAQNFRKPNDSKSFPGNMEPIPEGKYSIANIEFASGKDDYSGSHGPGLGPVWVALTAQFADDRGAFGFHLDANVIESPGSAGCVVFSSTQDLKRFVATLRKYDPKTLLVVWEA